MATKLKAAQIEQLKALGITSTTEEDARKKLIEGLKQNDVDNVDDETLSDLIQMYEAFYSGEEAELNELADEVSEEDEEEVEEEEEDAEEEEIEEEEETDPLLEMDRTALKNYIKEKSLEVKVLKSYTDDDIREKIREAEEALSENEEEEEIEEEEEVAPVKEEEKAKTKQTTKAKTPAPAAKKVVAKDENNQIFDARNNEEHVGFLDIFKEIFDEDQYEIKILKQGFTVRLAGTNATPTILNFDELRVIDGEFLKGNLYCNRLKNVEELDGFLTEELLEEEEVKKGKNTEYNPKFQRGMFRGETHPSIKGVTQDQVFEILGLSKGKKGWEVSDKGYLATALARATGQDKKMGENREKMEQKLDAAKAPEKKAGKPAAKK